MAGFAKKIRIDREALRGRLLGDRRGALGDARRFERAQVRVKEREQPGDDREREDRSERAAEDRAEHAVLVSLRPGERIDRRSGEIANESRVRACRRHAPRFHVFTSANGSLQDARHRDRRPSASRNAQGPRESLVAAARGDDPRWTGDPLEEEVSRSTPWGICAETAQISGRDSTQGVRPDPAGHPIACSTCRILAISALSPVSRASIALSI